MATLPQLASVGLQAGHRPDLARLRALVNRVTTGFSHEEWELARSLGHEGYVEHHLDHLAIDDSATEAQLAPLTSLGLTAYQIQSQQALSCQNELKHSHLLRAITSRRQLFERTVGFFNDHLSVFIWHARLHKVIDDRVVIRQHAFGSFHEMLVASAHSAAMLQYLDNHNNVASGPQENYARELMELHTLGVDGGYDEEDVREAARCLTGWRYVSDGGHPTYGNFLYVRGDHDDGEKTVLGQHFPAEQGQADGDQLLELLLTHPSTGRFLGRKLLRWFGVYEPPEALVEQVAAVYTATGGDIKSMLRVVLSPQAFAAMQPWKHPKTRRPHQFVAGLVRALGATLVQPHAIHAVEPTPLVDELARMGEMPFEWPTPAGYPDTAEAWNASPLVRWSFASRLLGGSLSAATVDPSSVLAALQATGASGWGAAIDELLTGGNLSASDRAALDAHAAGMGTIEWPQVAELIALAASSPSYQLY